MERGDSAGIRISGYFTGCICFSFSAEVSAAFVVVCVRLCPLVAALCRLWRHCVVCGSTCYPNGDGAQAPGKCFGRRPLCSHTAKVRRGKAIEAAIYAMMHARDRFGAGGQCVGPVGQRVGHVGVRERVGRGNRALPVGWAGGTREPAPGKELAAIPSSRASAGSAMPQTCARLCPFVAQCGAHPKETVSALTHSCHSTGVR